MRVTRPIVSDVEGKVRTVMVDSLAANFTVLQIDTQTIIQIWTASRWAEVCTVRLIGRPVSSKCSLMGRR